MEEWATERGAVDNRGDAQWSLEYLSRSMKGEQVPRSRTIRPPSARGAGGLFNDPSMASPSYEHPCLTAAGFSPLDRDATAN
eukprot:7257113-Pyramimonas_sp.AAC.1